MGKAFMKPQLHLQTHRFPSRDGRHWSAPELADLADGKISPEECSRRQKERVLAEGPYQSRKEQLADA